ncbi:MAG: serine racemase VanT catalytic subunit [Eubacteriales bacterium]|nr:serine racemase VanT catalytic subunit [Eubacteriales bacterium]
MTDDRKTEPTEHGSGKGRAWIEISKAHLLHNLAVLQEKLPPGCRLMPVVKADAYGHGAALVAKVCAGRGITDFCVATAREGQALRQQGISGQILVLGYTPPEQFCLLEKWRLSQTVVDEGYARQLNAFGHPLSVQIAVDTGMHRLGEDWNTPERLFPVFYMKNLRVEGIFTHLCTADGRRRRDRRFTKLQVQRFWGLTERLRREKLPCPNPHLLGSYGLLCCPEAGGVYARVGIGLYGTLSSRKDLGRLGQELLPVLSLYARVACVKTLEKGERAGYGLAFLARHKTRLAVLSIGYGDGIPRSLSGAKGQVLIGGQKAPIVGRICMDQMTVDVTDIRDVGAGDTAVLIGSSGTEEIGACDLAAWAGTISNEILSRLGSRLPRRLTP